MAITLQRLQSNDCRVIPIVLCTFFLPACLSASLPVSMPVCMSACLPVYLSVCLLACMSAFLSGYLPLCLPACTRLYVCMYLGTVTIGIEIYVLKKFTSICRLLLTSLSLYLSVCLSVLGHSQVLSVFVCVGVIVYVCVLPLMLFAP